MATALHAQPAPTPSKPDPAVLPISLIRPEPSSPIREEREDDNWDSDFEEGISISKIAALDREANDSSSPEDEFQDANNDTIRPSNVSSPAIRPAPMSAIVEDYSDLVGEDAGSRFEGSVARLKGYNSKQKRILHPKDISDSFAASSPSSTVNVLSSRFVSHPDPLPVASASKNSTSLPQAGQHIRKPTLPTGSRGSIDQYSEVDSEDYSDVFGSLELKGIVVEPGEFFSFGISRWSFSKPS